MFGIVAELRGINKHVEPLLLLKFAIFLWITALVLGLLFGDIVPFRSGEHWYSFLAFFPYGAAVLVSFFAVLRFLRELVTGDSGDWEG